MYTIILYLIINVIIIISIIVIVVYIVRLIFGTLSFFIYLLMLSLSLSLSLSLLLLLLLLLLSLFLFLSSLFQDPRARQLLTQARARARGSDPGHHQHRESPTLTSVRLLGRSSPKRTPWAQVNHTLATRRSSMISHVCWKGT